MAFSDNIGLNAAVAANDTVIAAYASRNSRPEYPSGHCFSPTSRSGCWEATTSRPRRKGMLVYALSDIAAAHDHVDNGPRNGASWCDSTTS